MSYFVEDDDTKVGGSGSDSDSDDNSDSEDEQEEELIIEPVDDLENEDEEDEDDDDDGELYLQKFDRAINDNYIVNNHPESVLQNYDEILVMIKVVRDKDGIIIDDLHRTIPYLTKYEKARILGQRAKQINSGSKLFIKVPEDILDGYIIAELELKAKRIPFIIRRPLPNGGSEYWSIKDLEDISF